MIRFSDICWVHESNNPQTPLPLFDMSEYQMMPGDYCLVVDETEHYIHFLSGNKILCINKNVQGEKYEYLQ